MLNNKDVSKAMLMWGVPQMHRQMLEQASDIYKSKHGMLASIPLICRGTKCPFYDTCTVDAGARIEGSRCLLEISAILTRFEDYCKHFGIENEGNEIDPKDLVDVSMIRDIIDLEIQIIRADSKIATSGDFMIKHIAQIDKKCNAYYEDIINPAAEYKNSLVEKRIKILGKLNATRKDKADLFKNTDSYSQKAKGIIDKIKEKAGEINLDDMEAINNSLNDDFQIIGDEQ